VWCARSGCDAACVRLLDGAGERCEVSDRLASMHWHFDTVQQIFNLVALLAGAVV
jgi:hypothetical protein